MFSEENPVKTNALRSRLSELRHVFAGIECDYAIAAALSFAATDRRNGEQRLEDVAQARREVGFFGCCAGNVTDGH